MVGVPERAANLKILRSARIVTLLLHLFYLAFIFPITLLVAAGKGIEERVWETGALVMQNTVNSQE